MRYGQLRSKPHPFHGCRKKQTFFSEGEVWDAIIRIADDENLPDGYHEPYVCNFCGWWHFATVKSGPTLLEAHKKEYETNILWELGYRSANIGMIENHPREHIRYRSFRGRSAAWFNRRKHFYGHLS